MKCNECDNEIVGELKQSFMVKGNFCSDHCQDMAERITVLMKKRNIPDLPVESFSKAKPYG